MSKKLYPYLFFLVFVILNFIFNFRVWQDILSLHASKSTTVNDGVITELLTETSYQNILNGKSIFAPTDKILYPFKTNFSMNDPGTSNVLFLLIFRPFLSSHQSLLIGISISILLGNVFMYMLLRKLGIESKIAFTFSLVFGFTPFLSHRVLGHYTYTPLYLFPLAYTIVSNFIESKNKNRKLLFALLFSFFVVFALFASFHYFIIIVLSIIFYLVWYFIFNRKKLFEFFYYNFIYILLSAISSFILLIPWVKSVKDLIAFDGLNNLKGWGGAISFAADLFSLVTPNEFNPIYKWFFSTVSSHFGFLSRLNVMFLNNSRHMIYPGLIILAVYGFFIIRKKSFSSKLIKKIMPWFWASILFFILTLGPFLKVFGEWSVSLEGVSVVFPLPFIILKYIPFLGNMRVPIRFIPAFAFFASLASAFILQDLLKGYKPKTKNIILIMFFVVFLIDQFYILPSPEPVQVPIKAYEYIKKDQDDVTVMDIPFTVRDGFEYIGFVHAISPMGATLIHEKPIIGGYVARVQPYIFDYYKNLKFIGYIAKITDKGNYHPRLEKPKEPVVYQTNLSAEDINTELDFLRIRYVLLKQDEKYTITIRDILEKSGMKVVLADQGFDLYTREIGELNFNKLKFGSNSKYEYLFLGQGFKPFNEDSSLMEESPSRVIMTTNDLDKNTLFFIAKAKKDTKELNIYLNDKFLGTQTIIPEKSTYELPINNYLQNGNNTFIFVLSDEEKQSATIDVVVYELELK